MSKAAVGDEVFAARRPPLAGNLTHRARRGPGRFARARRLRDRRDGPRGGQSGSHDYPITPKEHGVDFLMDRRHLWIRSPRQQAILRVRHEVIDAVRDYFNSRGFILADTPIFTPSACEGTTTLFPVPVLRRRHGLPDAERPALQRGQRDGARARVLLRPDVPRREVEDPSPPDRVLDGGARDGLRRRSTT